MGHRGPARLSCQPPWRAGPPQAAGDAAPPAGRRSGPEGQAGASAGGLAGAAPSHPRRSGGPYRRPAARRRCAAAAPWERRGPGRSLARIEQNNTVLYAERAMAGRAPAHHPHAFSPPEPRPGRPCQLRGTRAVHLAQAGWGSPQLYKTSCFVQTGPGQGSALTFGGGASPGWRSCRPLVSIWRPPRPGARGGGEWGADLAHHPAAPAGVAGRPSGPPPGGAGPGWAEVRPGGPGRSQSPGSGAWGEGAARRAWPEPAAPGSPLWGAGGGAQAGILDNRTVCHQGHLGSGSTHKGGLRYAPGTEARCGPL